MAAVATRTSTNSPMPHQKMTSSPKDVKKSNLKSDEAARKDSTVTNIEDAKTRSPPRIETAQPVQPPDPSAADARPAATTTAAAAAAPAPTKGKPLGPPPRPNASDAPDYFNTQHNTPANHYTTEPNPFESQFGTSSETPGKSLLLPPVASLTSPQSLIPGGTPGWGSLRSGPLSPAMLAGPTGTNDYFGEAPFSRGFPTPNESSLRTGLTPGGGGSMFPAPSPNTQALFNSIQSGGGATPGTLEFLRTVNRVSNGGQANQFAGPTSQPTTEASAAQANMESNHPDADAANGLYMLAQANNGHRNPYPASQPPSIQTALNNGSANQSQNTSPLTRTVNRASIGTASVEGVGGSDSDPTEQNKPTGKAAKGKKGAATNGRRKAEDTPVKTPASKRAKNNSAMNIKLQDMDDDDMMDDMDDMDMMDEDGKDTRKMTDEEKRKNFLERNRVAALKCRQRKKQWLANLQTKVELFSTENDALSQTVTQLREEIVNLKSLLIAHRDCPVSAAQGLGGNNMAMFIDGQHPHANPYGMGGPNGMPQGMPMQMPQAQAQMRGR